MAERTQAGMSVYLYLIDGRCCHFRQASDESMCDIIELFQRTKVFTQQHLVIHADDSLSTFPSRVVSRLDIVDDEPMHCICPSTWQNATEITAEEYAKKSADIQQRLRKDPRELISDGYFTFLLVYELLGGYRVFLESRIARPEGALQLHDITKSDLSLSAQHAPPPSIAIHRTDGGITFLNSANITRTIRCPVIAERPLNALMYAGTEVKDQV